MKRLQSLVAELLEEEELTKIKMENSKKVSDEKDEKSKDTINNLKEVKGLLQEEVRQKVMKFTYSQRSITLILAAQKTQKTLPDRPISV